MVPAFGASSNSVTWKESSLCLSGPGISHALAMADALSDGVVLSDKLTAGIMHLSVWAR
jgi:hypothetical protein